METGKGQQNTYLIDINVHLKPFQCFDNYFQLQLVSFAWVPLLLDDVTAQWTYRHHELNLQRIVL